MEDFVTALIVLAVLALPIAFVYVLSQEVASRGQAELVLPIMRVIRPRGQEDMSWLWLGGICAVVVLHRSGFHILGLAIRR